MRLLFAAGCACWIVLAAGCAARGAEVVRVSEDRWVTSARGGTGADDENARRAEVMDRAEGFCLEQGARLELDSLVSTPSRPGDTAASASVTFRCVSR